jgi:myo-inositol 2-dehydrogenase/D-chiro-inositol 1-dehydrogenase
MTITIGLIGAGKIGRIHGESIAHRNPGGKLIAVCDIVQDAAQSLADALRVDTVCTDPNEVISDPNIDAVVICSVSDTHAQLITEAANAGKHIFCEKPIALDLDKIDAALDAVERAGVKLQIGFQRRFDPSFHAAKTLIASGEVGEPRVLRITSRDPAPAPLAYLAGSGGIFMDMTIHDFDMARFLVDSPIEEVYAVGNVLVDPEIGEVAHDLDTAVITLQYANGAFCTIDNCRQSDYGYDQRVEWFGSGGRVVVGNHKPHQAVHSDKDGVHAAKPLYFYLERYMDAYVAEMQAFIEAVDQDKPIPVTGIDGREPAVIGMAAWKSVREHRPVKLSEIDPSKAS